MIDTHTHIYLEEFDADRDDVVSRAQQSGISHLVLPNVDLTTIEPMLALHRAYPDYTSVAMGLHPTEVRDDYRSALDLTLSHLDDTHIVAIGEVGIDLYWDATFRTQQMDALTAQTQWALDRNLPLIIHCRNGLNEILDVFANFSSLPPTVFHSFTGTPDDVRRIRNTGDFFFGINGIVTFKKSSLPDSLPEIGIDRILLETDSPYLAPVPNRGKRNESSNIPFICNAIAAALGLSTDEVSELTDANAYVLFNLQNNNRKMPFYT